MKSTVEQIRQRFDKDVERFSNLETGQSAKPPLQPSLMPGSCWTLAVGQGITR
jgi:hypothetical protein